MSFKTSDNLQRLSSLFSTRDTAHHLRRGLERGLLGDASQLDVLTLATSVWSFFCHLLHCGHPVSGRGRVWLVSWVEGILNTSTSRRESRGIQWVQAARSHAGRLPPMGQVPGSPWVSELQGVSLGTFCLTPSHPVSICLTLRKKNLFIFYWKGRSDLQRQRQKMFPSASSLPR